MASTGRHIDVNGRPFFIREAGPSAGRLVVCLPGLSATAMSFAALADRLADAHVVGIDLRGRGMTPAGGAYGWPAHAADVEALVARLGNADPEGFDLIGHAMGAYVAMELAARLSPRRMVLIEGLGQPDAAAHHRGLVHASRLGAVHCSANAYVEAIGEHRHVDALWEAHYRDELEPAPGGLRARTSREACFEDAAYGASHDARSLWPALPDDVLVVRALGGEGHAITTDDLNTFCSLHPQARAVEVDADHYGVMGHPAALTAIAEYLS